MATHRAVAHTAAYYGYDVDLPEERLFALSVLSMGTAAGAGKAAAYLEINKLVQALARRATWKELNKSVVAAVVQQVYTRLGLRLTQQKLGQAVPVIGVVLGAGLNARVMTSVIDDADHVYRERFLREKYALATTADVFSSAAGTDVVDLVDIVEAELEAPRPSPARATTANASTPAVSSSPFVG